MGTLSACAVLRKDGDGTDAEKQLALARKLGQFLTQSLGLSAEDLPEPIPMKFQAFGASKKFPKPTDAVAAAQPDTAPPAKRVRAKGA